MKRHLLLIALLALGMTGCRKAEESAPAKSTNSASSGNPLTAPVDYLGAVAQAKRVSEKTINLASLNNAIQLFNAQEDRYPNDLNELVARHYIGSLPAVPAGMRVAYNPATGEVKIFRQP
jgi:hypothetical protein